MPDVIGLEFDGGSSYLWLACGHRVLLATHHVTQVLATWILACPDCEPGRGGSDEHVKAKP